MEHQIENMRLKLSHFCSLTQELHEKSNDIEPIMSLITQLGNMIYSLEDKIDEKKNDTKCKHTDKRETEESSLNKSIIELKMENEDLRTLNHETHCRIRNIEEQLKEMQADVNDNSTDEDENVDQMIEEKRARMLTI